MSDDFEKMSTYELALHISTQTSGDEDGVGDWDDPAVAMRLAELVLAEKRRVQGTRSTTKTASRSPSQAMAEKPETYLRRPRIDVITYVDSDGNPDTATFIDGIPTDALLRHNIHHHTIDGGRSGEDHAWACSMYEHSTDPRFPEQVRAAFAEALEISSHDCKDECESCENCGDEPCPLITDSNA